MATVELVGRVLIALTVVVGLVYLIGKKARGGARRKLRTDKLIDVLGRQSLSRNSSVAVIRVADRALIVGVTDSNVRMIGEIELDAAAAAIAQSDPTARRGSREVSSPEDIYDGALDGIPSSPAGLDSLLTPADIAAIRSQRPSGADSVIDDAAHARVAATRTASRTAASRTASGTGPLAGSALSPATWRQTLDALREMTVRKG